MRFNSSFFSLLQEGIPTLLRHFLEHGARMGAGQTVNSVNSLFAKTVPWTVPAGDARGGVDIWQNAGTGAGGGVFAISTHKERITTNAGKRESHHRH